MDDLFALAVLPGEVCANCGMGAFDLVIDRLANIVEKAGPLGFLYAYLELRRDSAADERDLKRMLLYVLRVAAPEFQPTEKFDQFRVHIVDPKVENRLFAGLFYLLFHFFGDLGDYLLDPGRMYPAIADELCNGYARDFPADRVET
jgi:hypothetical protein